MNILARKFFQADANFHEVIILSDQEKFKWEQVSEMGSDLPRSWFELSRLSSLDRIEFIKEFWIKILPFNPTAHPLIVDFFHLLGDIAVVIRKEKPEDLYQAELVYCMADESTFFRGLPQADEQEVLELKRELNSLFPRDYLAFFQIHNGFGKLSEMGLFPLDEVPLARRRVMDLLLRAETPIHSGTSLVDAGALIPFFEALGLASFQCFYTDWYPGSEMGNVFLSGIDYTVSDVKDRRVWLENLAFPTFSDWLAHYLQGMNFSL